MTSAMPGAEPRLHLPYWQWPEADRLLWESAMANDDPFADGAGARLSKASQHSYLFAWRRFLGFLAIYEPSALEIAPSERLTVERVRRFVRHLAQTNIPRSVANQINMLYLAARVMMPERDWTWLKALKARLFAAAPAHAPTGPFITSVQLLDLGQQLMDESKPTLGTPISIEDAVRYRDGLMFALTAFNPLRRKNLAALEIGRHLVREGDCWHVLIPGQETKTETPIAARIPDILEPYLAIYLNTIRPQLARGTDCDALWLNSMGHALAYAAIGEIFSSHSMRRLGIRITPHDVRDAVATTWALFAPDRITVASELLSHTDERSLRYYNRARGISASRVHSRLIAEMRRKDDRHRPADS